MATKALTLTPLQWVVLRAYALSLPAGSDSRAQVCQMLQGSQPQRRGPALVLAAETGLLRNGQITPAGTAAAQHLLTKTDKQRPKWIKPP